MFSKNYIILFIFYNKSSYKFPGMIYTISRSIINKAQPSDNSIVP